MRHLFYHIISLLFAFCSLMAASGCIENDLPYPRIPQRILEIAAEGEIKSAYIDSLAYKVNLYLDESVDICNLKFNKFVTTPNASCDVDLLQGTHDLSHTLWLTLSLYQDYSWEIKANQSIERYFEVEGQVGESIIDPAALRVIVTVSEGTDLSKLKLQRVKLGAKDVSTMSPEITPGTLDLSYPLAVDITTHDRTQTWTIYAQVSETIVSTYQVDAWSKVVWAYGNGPADANNGFEYRLESDSEWTPVPEQFVSRNQGAFSCFIPHLKPNTKYLVRAVSDDNKGNEVEVTTQDVADLPGGDFEEWHMNAKDMWCPWNENGAKFWDTGNAGSITLNQNLTTPTDYTPDGVGKAVKCETKFVSLFGIGKLGSGSIFTGDYVRTDGTNGVLAFGRSWNLHPTKLRGYFQYSAANIDYASSEFEKLKGVPDTCHIYVALTDWSTPYEIRTNPKNRQLFNKNADFIIAYGEMQFSGKMDKYQEFEITLNYRNTFAIPSFLQITCSASKYGDYFTGGSGSILYVDRFSLDYDY